VGDVLCLLSAGAAGPIVMVLGEGPLRTKELTDRVPGFAPRTVYRSAGKLAELGVLERDEEPGVPSKVVHCLARPCGQDLFELLDSFATASFSRLPDGTIDAHAWASIGLLGDLWRSGMVDELSCEPRSPTQLSRAENELSFHQVNRRANLFKAGGFLCDAPGDGRNRCYALTERARRAMTLVAGVGRWCHDHMAREDAMGLTAPEVTTVLRTALPLVRVPEHAGKSMKLNVLGRGEPLGGEGETLWARVEPDGVVHGCASPTVSVDGWARAKVRTWLAASLDGRREKVQHGGDVGLVNACLERLHSGLWPTAE
jgi:DNA-binding HxlR family transcriptional regulator